MSRRNVLTKYQVWSSANSASITPSSETTVDQLDVIKYIIKIDPTVVCELLVQFTDDKNTQSPTWRNLQMGQTLSLNGATDTEYTVNIKEHSCFKLRLNTTNNSGTGNINAWISGANIGA